MDERIVELYTDGACSGNPGVGGWAAILKFGDYEKELSGSEAHTTNNRMELSAIIYGLQALKYPIKVEVYSDSAYVVNAINKDWLSSWKRNNWRNAAKEPVSNQDLWIKLDEQMKIHETSFHKVKGHADHEYNNRADALAVKAVQDFKADNNV